MKSRNEDEETTGRLTCQFGLPRSGLYAVAGWYVNGTGGGWRQTQGAALHEIDAEGASRRFLTLEALPLGELREAVARCRSLGATFWVQLRDPYNWLASLDKGVAEWAVAWRPERPLERWKEYARLCLADDSWLSYNLWFDDADYRRRLARRFGFRHLLDGEPWLQVPERGGGSSFDKEAYAGRAQEMAVLGRFSRFADDPDWRAQFDDETISLAERLFAMRRPW